MGSSEEGLKRIGPWGRLLSQLRRPHDHRTYVVLTHSFLELAVNKLLDLRCRRPTELTNSRDFAHSTKVTLLYEMGVLSEHDRKLLHWFRRLRNDIAHDFHFDLTAGRLDALADPKHRDPKNFASLCNAVVFDILNRHYHDLVELVMAPDDIQENDTAQLWVEIPAPPTVVRFKDDPSTLHMSEKEATRLGLI